MASLRVGMLGCGGIGRRHASSLSTLESVKLVAFCDIREEAAKAFNEEYAAGKGLLFKDFAEMYEEAALDVVYVCLPPFAHSTEVEEAAERGVHIFIEKPIALDVALANRMVNAVEKAGVKSQVGFVFRFGTAVEAVRKMIEEGSLGQVGLLTARYFCNALHAPWWRERAKSGGQVVEQAIHVFDLLRHLAGEPEVVFCLMDNLYHRRVENYTVEDVSATAARFRSGALAVVAATNAAIPGRWIADYRLVAQKATIDFADANNATIYHTDKPWASTTQIASQKDMYLAETLDLLEAIREDRETRIPMMEGAKTLQLVLAARDSAGQGKPIKL
ncbi:MAG: Gfo/Idh/MocA family oxidoreductase [Candidatus Bathyarchaeia archaeon]